MKKFRYMLIFLLALIVCVSPVYAFAETGEYVYLGGQPIGISIDVGGLYVEQVTGVETEYGTAQVEGLLVGDVIKEINGNRVRSVDDIELYLEDEPVELTVIRGGISAAITVRPIAEIYTGLLRLGVKIRDRVYGVGTVTYVRGDGSFTALGHEISGEDGARLPFYGGNVHYCKVVGVKRGVKGEAGAILSSLAPDSVLGDVQCNNSFGVAGRLSCNFDKSEKIRLAPREHVHPGEVKIRTCVSGEAEYYDAEIIKASRQSTRAEKGLIIRITDKKLLSLTGGVVRGMSGSPIIQDGMLVGAVTHVLLNDFSKGYGIYADFLN